MELLALRFPSREHLLLGPIDRFRDSLGIGPLARAWTADKVRMIALHSIAVGALDLGWRGVGRDPQDFMGQTLRSDAFQEKR